MMTIMIGGSWSKRFTSAALCSVMALLSGCAQTRTDTKPTSTAQSASVPEPAPEPAPAPTTSTSAKAGNVQDTPSIGSATMKPDGTIVLQLRATDGTGIQGDAQLVYPPSHPQYQEVLKHLGGLKPGEQKPVPPWPD